MSHGGGAYVQWGWRIRPMGVAYTSNGGGVYVQWGWRIRPMGVVYTSKGAKVAYKSKGPRKHTIIVDRGYANGSQSSS